jgi:hypothetical protein
MYSPFLLGEADAMTMGFLNLTPQYSTARFGFIIFTSCIFKKWKKNSLSAIFLPT